MNSLCHLAAEALKTEQSSLSTGRVSRRGSDYRLLRNCRFPLNLGIFASNKDTGFGLTGTSNIHSGISKPVVCQTYGLQPGGLCGNNYRNKESDENRQRQFRQPKTRGLSAGSTEITETAGQVWCSNLSLALIYNLHPSDVTRHSPMPVPVLPRRARESARSLVE